MEVLIKAFTNGHIKNPYLSVKINSETLENISGWYDLQKVKTDSKIKGDLPLTLSIGTGGIIVPFQPPPVSSYGLENAKMTITTGSVVFSAQVKHEGEWFETTPFALKDVVEGNFILDDTCVHPYIFNINPFNITDFPHEEGIDAIADFFENLNGHSNFYVSHNLNDVLQAIVDEWETAVNLRTSIYYILYEDIYIVY